MKTLSPASSAGLSRRAFKNFLLMWIVIFLAAFTVAFVSNIARAKADVVMLPIGGLMKVSAPAEIAGFATPSSPALVEKACQSLLSPTPQAGRMPFTEGGQDRVWNRRNAGSGESNVISAIKAYRECARKVALEELAKN